MANISKDLVVIIDEESRKSNLLDRWFSEGSKQNEKNHVIETPLGNKRKVKGTLLIKPEIGRQAEEYIYLEITDTCNFHCAHCGVKDNINGVALEKVTADEAKYLTDKFLAAFSKQVQHIEERKIGSRNIYFGGGEPLLNPSEFRRVNSYFADAEKSERIVITNGCALPLDLENLEKFVSQYKLPIVFLTYAKAHRSQYERLARNGKPALAEFIPMDVAPKNALDKKAEILTRNFSKIGAPFAVNVVDGKYRLANDLRSYILKHTRNATITASNLPLFETVMDGTRKPCSQGYELSIRSNGDMYPHCYDIFAGKNKVGVVGFLVK
ncbi:MAG: radical SAM protein [Nanoarchaeota archaeon]|nr:radical SAM protein [Nanoarchaeota archaeon]